MSDEDTFSAKSSLACLRLPFENTLIVILVLLFGFFVWVAMVSATLPDSLETMEVGPGRFPLAGAVLGMVSCLFAFAYSVKRKIQDKQNAARQSRVDYLEIRRPVSILLGVVLICLWVEGMSEIGFYITSILITPLFLLLGGERRLSWIVSFTAIFVLFIYLCFSLLLHIDFP